MYETILHPEVKKAVRQTIGQTRCFERAESPDKLQEILAQHGYFISGRDARSEYARKRRELKWGRMVERYKARNPSRRTYRV